mgnify:CR=1 FL=1
MEIDSLILLGVNIDHVATLRQARGTPYPDPVEAAALAENSGADSITLHLREDRRHIQDRDVLVLRERLRTRMNLEMAVTPEMLAFAEQVRPQDCCLVPERREELTTEGGLDVAGQLSRVREACSRLAGAGDNACAVQRPRRNHAIDPAETQPGQADAMHPPRRPQIGARPAARDGDILDRPGK